MHITQLTKELLQTYTDSYIQTINTLVPTIYTDKAVIFDMFNQMNAQGTQVYVAIDEDHGIVGSVTVLNEAKMIRGGVRAGHIEDLVVHEHAQGKGVGGKLLEKAMQAAKESGCYKIILDCDTDLSTYYQKKGFKINGVFMRKYI